MSHIPLMIKIFATIGMTLCLAAGTACVIEIIRQLVIARILKLNRTHKILELIKAGIEEVEKNKDGGAK